MKQLHLEKLIWDNYDDVTKLKVNKRPFIIMLEKIW